MFSGVTPAKSAGVGGLAGVDVEKSTPAKQKFRVMCVDLLTGGESLCHNGVSTHRPVLSPPPRGCSY